MMNESRSLSAEIDEQAALWFSRSRARRLTTQEQQQLDHGCNAPPPMRRPIVRCSRFGVIAH